ncbi:MAG TPA: hypothetical protein VMT76_01365 [Puia sp.]|nr:hypothetical protein [Puia sp.]
MKKIISIIFLSSILQVSLGQVKDPSDDGRKIRIPVVFHVLYSNNEENINDSLLLNELNGANLDFTAKNNMAVIDLDFKDLVGNPNIEFYLLDSMLQKSGTKGVQRISENGNLDLNQLLISANNCLNVLTALQGNASDILSDRVNLNYGDVGELASAHCITKSVKLVSFNYQANFDIKKIIIQDLKYIQ